MVRDPFAREAPPDAAEILDVLADEDARTIIRTLNEPMTAKEIQERCDIPESTLYRKLDRLTETGLLHQQTRIRRDGRHTSEYEPAFDEVTIVREEETGGFAVRIKRPRKRADERLAELWTEVSREL
ncbi:MAG: DUF7342 family protein [Halobacteriota archaeon]